MKHNLRNSHNKLQVLKTDHVPIFMHLLILNLFVSNVCRMTQTREQGIALELIKAGVSILLIKSH